VELDVPSVFVSGYVHSKELNCKSCDGTGSIGSFTCGACAGNGSYTVGCGGPASIDPNHPALGADCLQCGYQVPLEEVKQAPLEEVTVKCSP